ncbi:cupin domain-containing protein (plasmid) [Phyllobacterium sp. 628]|uniref:cupin domain-containing protein n=1 Tax=Phyllobacterium sp. 628 TaxID=2718938 RepID=UPI0016627651|nr:cupin domain-containing protein [Phyllobacterium sp. 628]QND54645.1 cupin domain-containing protein [Phyllobacterium sp. 628]
MTEAIVNLADLNLRQLKTGKRFEVGLGEIGRLLGLDGLGAILHVVPAGKTAWPFHRHHGCDELFLVLEGQGEVRMGERRLPIRAGDCIGAPDGGDAHQIINTSDAELRYIVFPI